MKIGLLASNPELYSNKRILEAGELRGHEMHFLNLKYCYMKLDADTPEIHYRGGKVLNDFDAVILYPNVPHFLVRNTSITDNEIFFWKLKSVE